MTISATITGIQLSSTAPISSIKITDTVGLQTLDMSLISNSLRDIDTGTDYTLSLENVFNGNDVFLDLAALSTAVFVEPDASNLVDVKCSIFSVSPYAFVQDATVTFDGGGSATIGSIKAVPGTKLILHGTDVNGVDDEDAIALAITATSA
jgi:hypothetical protein